MKQSAIVLLDIFLAFRQQVIEGVVTDTLPHALHPLFPLFLRGGTHSVHRVLTLHNLTLAVSLTGLDKVRGGGVQFETVTLLTIMDLPHFDILQRDNPSGLLIGGVFEIIETVIVEDEPSSLPTLVPSSLFPKPTFSVGVEEGVH